MGSRRGIAVVLFTTLVVFGAPARAAFDHGHPTFARVLERHVRSGWVSYGALARDRADLDAYAAALAAVSADEVSRFTPAEAKAFWINAYNALTLKLIVDKKPKGSIKDLDKPWASSIFAVAGKVRSLDEIEHEILRKAFADPRLHAVLVCAAKSCPVLFSKPYKAAELESQLDAAARRWLSGSKRNYWAPAEGKVYLSEIFKWFPQDFPSAKKGDGFVGARAFLSRYGGVDVPPDAPIVWLEYDWSLNGDWL